MIALTGIINFNSTLVRLTAVNLVRNFVYSGPEKQIYQLVWISFRRRSMIARFFLAIDNAREIGETHFFNQ